METFISTLIPCEIRFQPNQFLHVSDTPLLDICGAYEYSEDGTYKIPRGLRLVTSGFFNTAAEAENFSRGLAMTWMGLMCFTMGVKAVLPRTECVLRRIDKSGRYRVRVYFYDVAPSTVTRPLETDVLTTVQQHIAQLPQKEADRVALAIRWYTVGVGQPDDLNRFLSHWIGLEAVGDILHNRIHKFDRAPCTICNHPAGVDHNGRSGGMKHVLAVVSGRSELYQELDHARDMIFHGLEDIQVHQETIVKNVRHLEVALGRAILEVIKPLGSTEAVSVAEPLRTVGIIPQVYIDGTFIDQPLTETTSGKNDDDGDLTLTVKQSMVIKDTVKAQIVDKTRYVRLRFRHSVDSSTIGRPPRLWSHSRYLSEQRQRVYVFIEQTCRCSCSGDVRRHRAAYFDPVLAGHDLD
jgi:hypothetical protein